MNPSGMRKTVGGIALSFVLAVVLGISGVIAPGGGAALGASTTLTILGGEVQVSRNGGAFEPAADGAIIGPGDVIRTGADARAVLTYFEGSTVSVDPSSELAIDEASSNPDGSTVVVMSQNLGRTWHVVTKLITGGSKYEVRTPAATASVRGTEFAVGVGRDATGNSVTDIATSGGAVAVAAPATAADPQPEPVLVPAGFRTTTTSGERTPQAPTIVPEPERKVTVTIGSANALVVDPLGRSNGYKDGRLVLQTPGAQVVRTAGTLLITLPNIPDGKISTVVARAADAGSSSADVPVITTVQEQGKSSTLVEDTVKPTEIVTGLEVKVSGAGPEATPEVRRVTEDEKKELNTGKVVEAPKVEVRRVAARPGLGDPSVIARIAEERRGEPAGGATAGPATEARKAAQAPAVAPAPAAPAQEEPRAPSFVQPLPFQGAPSAANQLREEVKRQEASTKIEAEIKGSEQLQQAAETATKVAESAKIVAQSGQQRAADDKARHEQQLKAAEEAAREAQRKLLEATDAARKKEAEEAARQAEAQKQASEAARRRAEIEAKQKADEAARADAARKAAAEVAERARLDGERLRQQQQQQQQQQGGGSSGGGSSGGGSSGGGSSNDGKKGSGKSEDTTPGGGVKLPELPRLPGSQKP